jgi:hypothetical protein
MRSHQFFVLWLSLVLVCFSFAEEVTLSKETLKDKIKGGWAGQVIGCTFGGPTEFQWNSTFIPGHVPIPWDETRMQWYYDHAPSLYDDVYMDLTFVQVFEEKGLDAPASDFATAFAYADYALWHANNMARWNIKNGILPPESGHWLNNPHSDDIDYQIEADFSGLMAPGMPNTSAEISDKIGHIMNYGDGWYGGVYVGAMYSLAFVSDDINYVVEKALEVIPEESSYYKCQADVIKYYKMYPDDWKMAWLKIQDLWGKDIGCPDGVFRSFNIDAKINSAWILLGLLYGQGDFGKTISISTRAGDDSDCNPASAAGILGTMLGYDKIPDYWKQGLDKVEDRDFKYTTMSLNDTYDMSMRQALQVIEKNGGSIDENNVTIKVQEPQPVRLEVGFENHHPVERRRVNKRFGDHFEFEFDGIGFVATGGVRNNGPKDRTIEVDMHIDGKKVENVTLSTEWIDRRESAFWRYQLPKGMHTIRLEIKNPAKDIEFEINDVIVYDYQPEPSKY